MPCITMALTYVPLHHADIEEALAYSAFMAWCISELSPSR